MNVAEAHSAEDGTSPGALGKSDGQPNADNIKCPDGNGE